MADLQGFTGDQLRLPFTEWKRLSDALRPRLRPEVRKWLGRWEVLDLVFSPMNDEERRGMRFGHYMGWFDRADVDGVSVPDGKTNKR